MNKRSSNLNEASEAMFETALQYAAVLPGGDLPRSKAALKEYDDIYYDAEGTERMDISKTENLLVMRERMAAKINQAAKIKDKLKRDGLRRSNSLNAARTWDKKVLENGFLPDKDFGAEKRTVSKLAQEILSSDYELVGDLKDYEVGNVIVDPENITDTLLVNLGLEEYVPEKKASEIDKMAGRAQAIPKIKEMLRGLEALEINRQKRGEKKFMRLFTITEGEYAGYILGTQVNHGHKLLFRTDIHGAIRRLENIRQGYDEEIMGLTQIDEKVREIKDLLTDHEKEIRAAFQEYLEEKKTDSKAVMKKPDVMKEYEESIANLLENLGGVINGEKIKIQEQLKGSQNLIGKQTITAKTKTVKGKQIEIAAEEREILNIGAKLAKLSAIHDAFAKRMKAIASIQTYLLADEHILKAEVSRMETPFAEFVVRVEELHEKFRIYKGKTLSEEEQLKLKNNMRRLIVEPLESSFPEDRVALEPYGSFKSAMIEQTEKTMGVVKDTDSDLAAKEFTKIYLIAKVVRLHKDLQKFYSDNLSGLDPQISEKTLREIEAIKVRFGEKKVAPNIEVQDFEKQYDEFYHLVNSLRKRTVEINKLDESIQNLEKQLPVMASLKEEAVNGGFLGAQLMDLNGQKKRISEEKKARKDLKNEAKERFRNFDFGEIVRNLNSKLNCSEEEKA